MIKQIKHNRIVGRLHSYLEMLVVSTINYDRSVDYTHDNLNIFSIFRDSKRLYLFKQSVETININGLTFDEKVDIIVEWIHINKNDYRIIIL